MSFRSSALNRTGVEFFINIILNIKKTEILTVTWLSFFVGLIFISYSYLLTITVTVWPITPCSTVTWFIVITGAIWNFVGYYCWRRTFKFKRALNLTKGFKLWVFVFAIVLLYSYRINYTLSWCFWSIVFSCWNRNVRYLNWKFCDMSKTSTESRSSRQSPSSPNEWIGKSSFSPE